MKLATSILSLALVVLAASLAFVAITWRERAGTWIMNRPWVAHLLFGVFFGLLVTMLVLDAFYTPPKCE